LAQTQYSLIRDLADGEFHSGTALARSASTSRVAIWKKVRSLIDMGFDIYAVRGKGYRLSEPIELLDHDRILAAVGADVLVQIGGVQIELEVKSTNDLVLERARAANVSRLALFAEYQHGGKGRRGRKWISPAGQNIYLSVLWKMAEHSAPIEGLSLAVGVSVVRAMAAMGCDVMLKWPNDIYWMGRKVAGILIEMSGEASGPTALVVGVGVNVKMPIGVGATIDQPWVDLESIRGDVVPRNELAGRLLAEIARLLISFQKSGFAAFKPDFERFDFLKGKSVTVKVHDRELIGEALGVDEQGALWVSIGGSCQRFFSADVSVRAHS